MRKLKLEIQISVDGFIADTKGDTRWMVWPYSNTGWNWDKALQQYHIDLTMSSDCILLSGHMAGGFHNHWETIARDELNPQRTFARPVTEMKKVVFSKTIKKSLWHNTVIARDIKKTIGKLK